MLEDNVPGPKYKNFYRIVKRLEDSKIVESYKDSISKKKYIYLSQKGQNTMQASEPSSINHETLIHDIKVSEISREFLKRGWVANVDLEHRISNRRELGLKTGSIPDAAFFGVKKGLDFKIAFELELTRKSKSRIIEKAQFYANSNLYDYMIYFFGQDSMMASYESYIKEVLNPSQFSKFIFVYCPSLSVSPPDISTVRANFKGLGTSLLSIFEK